MPEPSQPKRGYVPASRIWTVLPNRGEWVVKRRDASRSDSRHATREAAIERGRDLAVRYDGKLRVVTPGQGVEELDLRGGNPPRTDRWRPQERAG